MPKGRELAKANFIASEPTANEQGGIEVGFTCALVNESPQLAFSRLEDLYDLKHLSQGKEELVELINKYPEVTSTTSYDIGECSLPPMEIDTEDAEPICISETCERNDRDGHFE